MSLLSSLIADKVFKTIDYQTGIYKQNIELATPKEIELYKNLIKTI